MTQDFYKRAQDLHEEFQKRELLYLNTERKWNSMIWNKDLNLPLQEYLQKINKREKETEEIQRNLMIQMEELDKRTDSLFLKLEKLGMLRNSMTHLPAAYQFSDLTGSSLQMYRTTNNFHTGPNSVLSLLEQKLKSVSTQTENKHYCEKCFAQEWIPEKSHHSCETESSLLPATVKQTELDLNQQSAYSIKSQSDSSVILNYNPNVSQTLSTTVVNEPLLISSNVNKITAVNSTINEEKDRGSPEQNINFAASSGERRSLPQQDSSQNVSQPDKLTFLETENAVNDVQRTEELPTANQMIDAEPRFISNDKSEILETGEEDNIDASVSKSDAESMNHEFDFLETETVGVSKKVKFQDNAKHALSSSKGISTVEKLNKSMSERDEIPKFNLKSDKKIRGVVDKSSKISKISDDKSDTSDGVSGTHSPNISASDSDSSFGKETPLTASAAYQALLGNTVIPEKKNIKKYSDSESDEVENALANAVRRSSHVPPKSAQVKKDEKPAPQQTESKPASKPSKPPAGSKQKSKLSKKTRKMLGIDTSSGSEVELAVKPPAKKINEDSDEFDFYD